jgi:hypothetical protein
VAGGAGRRGAISAVIHKFDLWIDHQKLFVFATLAGL